MEIDLAKNELTQLLFTRNWPVLRLNLLHDDPACQKQTWNFLDHPRNRKVLGLKGQGDRRPGALWIMRRMLQDRRLRAKFLRDHGNVIIDGQAQWNVLSRPPK